MILAQADIMYSNMCYQFLLKSAAKSSLSSMGTDEVLDLPCVMILEIPIVPSKACNKGTRVVQTYLRMILGTSNLGASISHKIVRYTSYALLPGYLDGVFLNNKVSHVCSKQSF